ncbi:MAG: zinc ribbon domain-containing protein [Ruminococcaceae bacterium]|nr:zinc ribbon domain-containing protein [Oscillospiraceae bacterium]
MRGSCHRCRAPLPEWGAFCPTCGAPIEVPPTERVCPTCGYRQSVDRHICWRCGVPLQEPASPPPPAYAPPRPPYVPADRYGGMPMKWYKFLIYFLLFADTVLNILNGILILNGVHDVSERVYARYEGLLTLQVFCGLSGVAMGVFAFFTRFRLSALCENGPTMVYLLYTGAIVVNLVYMTGMVIVMGSVDTEFFIRIVSNVLVDGIILACQHEYFAKRRHLFVN